jgi:hypothetical protein
MQQDLESKPRWLQRTEHVNGDQESFEQRIHFRRVTDRPDCPRRRASDRVTVAGRRASDRPVLEDTH